MAVCWSVGARIGGTLLGLPEAGRHGDTHEEKDREPERVPSLRDGSVSLVGSVVVVHAAAAAAAGTGGRSAGCVALELTSAWSLLDMRMFAWYTSELRVEWGWATV